jgi:hypothetical protein
LTSGTGYVAPNAKDQRKGYQPHRRRVYSLFKAFFGGCLALKRSERCPDKLQIHLSRYALSLSPDALNVASKVTKEASDVMR